MRHYFDTVFNTSGGPVEGVKVRLTDAAGNAVSIFSDDSGTPLLNGTAISNARGLFEFYVPFATYSLNYYSPSGTLIQVIPKVYMGSDATDALIAARDAAIDAAATAGIDAGLAADSAAAAAVTQTEVNGSLAGVVAGLGTLSADIITTQQMLVDTLAFV